MDRNQEIPWLCRVSDSTEDDRFVGIRFDGEGLQAYFPLGYRLGKTAEEQRKDIRLLIRVLSRFAKKRELSLSRFPGGKTEEGYPVQAALTVLDTYYSRGYYTENEQIFRKNDRGPVSWPRTVRTQRGWPQDDSWIYLDTINRSSRVNSASYLTRINEYWVAETYRKLGVLFAPAVPRRPVIPFDERRFLAALRNRLRQENNDRNKALFAAMIDLTENRARQGQSEWLHFGVNRFAPVWERMIDYRFSTFSDRRQRNYFPRATWKLVAGGAEPEATLKPDTLMEDGERIFVLDAKYYRYGCTGDPGHLPHTSDISKQIVYGERVAKAKAGEIGLFDPQVYNAFLMPFDREDPPEALRDFTRGRDMVRIGEVEANWKWEDASNYTRIQGVLVDVKWMMERAVRQSAEDIHRLAELVASAFRDRPES